MRSPQLRLKTRPGIRVPSPQSSAVAGPSSDCLLPDTCIIARLVLVVNGTFGQFFVNPMYYQRKGTCTSTRV